MNTGGQRTRLWDGEADTARAVTSFETRLLLWVPSGRWGPRRARVEQCEAALLAELVYDQLLKDGVKLRPGWKATLSWTPNPGSRSWNIVVELRPNAVWRHGRMFFELPRMLETGHSPLLAHARR
jgi:hypothetical protein